MGNFRRSLTGAPGHLKGSVITDNTARAYVRAVRKLLTTRALGEAVEQGNLLDSNLVASTRRSSKKWTRLLRGMRGTRPAPSCC